MLVLEVGFNNLHQLLAGLYQDMLPLCGSIAGVANGIAGLGALIYISYRVWQALARADEIDVFPLLRPFALGFCIMFFPTLVLGTINGVMSPVVKGCHNLLEEQVMDMNKYQQQKDQLEENMFKNAGLGFMVDNEEYEQQIEELDWNPTSLVIWSAMKQLRDMFSLKRLLTNILRIILEFIFDCAALVVDTLRTFFLIVLAILGPISFAISAFDGFQSTLVHWLSRYLSVYLWLPIADIFSAILSRIQVLTLEYEVANMATNPFASGLSSLTYLFFLVIGIIGYFSIPTISNWVIQCGGMGGYMRNMNKAGLSAGRKVGAGIGAATGNPIGLLLKK